MQTLSADDSLAAAVLVTIDGQMLDVEMVNFSPFDWQVTYCLKTDSAVLAEKQGVLDLDAFSGGLQNQSIEKVAYIGFFRPQEPTKEPPSIADPVELKVSVVGQLSYVVQASQSTYKYGVGFIGLSLDPKSPFEHFFFYHHAVLAKQVCTEDETGSGATDAAPLAPPSDEQGSISPHVDEMHDDETSSSLSDSQEPPQGRKKRSIFIGDVLVEEGLIEQAVLDGVLAEHQGKQTRRLGEILVKQQLIQEEILYQTLAKRFEMPYVNLDEVPMNSEAIQSIDHEILCKYQILPLDCDEKSLLIAISDPLDLELYDVLRFHVAKEISEVLASPQQIKHHLEENLTVVEYPQPTEIDLTEELDLEGEALQLEDTIDEEDEDVVAESDNIIVKLANQVILDGYRQGTSDIHIEPNGHRQNTVIRFRIDGECILYKHIPPQYRKPLVGRIKIMAKLDIAETRKPQDGKIRFRIPGKTIELRVATIPTVNGNEDVVMRILASSKPLPLEEMGMSARNFSEFESIIQKPYGLILCVGPTGSGKTTTLHSALRTINHIERKIWTAEDPVEITQAGLRQVQVNPKIGFTFANALRAFLRADPDVVMIGEMRDEETATIAVQASLTGHLVFSTLHTNSAPETITRLLDMGLDPFSFADSLLGVIAQRLARRLCDACRQPYHASDEEYRQIVEAYGAEKLERQFNVSAPSNLLLWRSAGCKTCKESGYKGRTALHELLIANDEIKAAIERRAPVADIRQLAMASGMTTLLEDGVEKILSGITDLKQVLAVCSR